MNPIMANSSVNVDACRFCGRSSDLLINIWESEGLELELESKIIKHLKINLAQNDSLPNAVCFYCADIIDTWDKFFTMCTESQTQHKKTQEVVVETFPNDPEPIDVYFDDDNRWDDDFSDSDDQPLSLTVNSLDKTVDETPKKKKKIKDDEDWVANGKAACSKCDKLFKDKKYAAKHESNCGEKTKRQFACDICGQKYKSAVNLKRHMDRDHFSDQEECPVCKKPIAGRKMARHLKSEHSIKREEDNEKKFRCKLCAMWFTNKYTRNEHLKKVHKEKEIVKCESCDFEGLRHIVKRHARSVHSQKRFPCNLCKNAFKTMHMLKMHMTAHSELRCYTCDVCGMGFKRLNNVRDHMKCHQKKSNQCQICGNFFARKRYLAVHEQTIHNHYADGKIPEEKGFECGTCGAKLKWKKNLLAHMRIHTGEKPYICKICHRGFVCHGSLRAHMAKHSVANEPPLLGDSDPLSIIEVSVLNHYNQSLHMQQGMT